MKTSDAEPRFNSDGVIAAISQDVSTDQVLMLAWMNAEALKLTLETGYAVYWSRARQALWYPGDKHAQRVLEARIDDDGDAVLLRVDQKGPASQTGARSCFSRVMYEEDTAMLGLS